MQKGYFSLLVKDYSNIVDQRLKYIYSSKVKVLSNQEQIFNHLEYAFQRVSGSKIAIYTVYIIMHLLVIMYCELLYMYS